jgi:hypothetical protein
MNYEIPRKFRNKWKKELVTLYKDEAVSYMRGTHNEALALSKLPPFIGVPVLFVLNAASTILAADHARIKRNVLESVKSAWQKLPASPINHLEKEPNNTINEKEKEEKEEEESKNIRLEDVLDELIKSAFSLTCAHDGFVKVFDMKGFKQKVATVSAHFHPIVDWLPHAHLAVQQAAYGKDWNAFKHFFAAEEVSNIALMITAIPEEHPVVGTVFGYYNDTVHKTSAEEDKDDATTLSGYDSLLRKKYMKKPHPLSTILLPPLVGNQLVMPAIVSTALTRLGDEITLFEINQTCFEQDRYNHQRKNGRPVVRPRKEQDPCNTIPCNPCDQFEFWAFNWTLESLIWYNECKHATRICAKTPSFR